MRLGVLPAFTAKVNGEDVRVDHRTFTMRERRQSRMVLLENLNDGLVIDEGDTMAALLWVVLNRGDEAVGFDEIFDTLELGALADAEADALDTDDPSQ